MNSATTGLLYLPSEQVSEHLQPGHTRRCPECWKVEGTCQSICVAEEQHRWNPASSVLKREAGVIHLILLDFASPKMVHGALRVDFRLKGAGSESKLRASDDVEVVVCCVSACVAFSPDSCAEDDYVFRYAWLPVRQALMGFP